MAKINKRKTTMRNTNASSIRKMINAALTSKMELETATFTNTGTATPAAGTFQFITQGIIQGTGSSQRQGNQITLSKVRAKINTFAVGVSGITRYVLYQDKMSNGATPLVTDILDSANSIAALNGLTVKTEKRYHILADFTHNVPIGGEGIKVYDTTFSSKLLKPVTYLANTSVVGANGRNAVFLLVLGSATNIYDYSFQIEYTDA